MTVCFHFHSSAMGMRLLPQRAEQTGAPILLTDTNIERKPWQVLFWLLAGLGISLFDASMSDHCP